MREPVPDRLRAREDDSRVINARGVFSRQEEDRPHQVHLLVASAGVTGPLGRTDADLRSYTLEEFEEVAVRGKDKGRVFGDDGLVSLHGPREFIECDCFRALVVSLRVDFSGFRVCHAADLLNLTVGFRLDLVQIAHTIAANSGGLAV